MSTAEFTAYTAAKYVEDYNEAYGQYRKELSTRAIRKGLRRRRRIERRLPRLVRGWLARIEKVAANGDTGCLIQVERALRV